MPSQTRNPAVVARGDSEIHQLGSMVGSNHSASPREKQNSSAGDSGAVLKQLEILYQRCVYLAHAVDVGGLRFLDAVDLAWDAADWAGVLASAGPDKVQDVLARAFMGIKREAA